MCLRVLCSDRFTGGPCGRASRQNIGATPVKRDSFEADATRTHVPLPFLKILMFDSASSFCRSLSVRDEPGRLDGLSQTDTIVGEYRFLAGGLGPSQKMGLRCDVSRPGT